MDRIRQSALRLIHDSKVTGRIYMITLASAMLILVMVIRGPEQNGSYISDEDGNVIGIRRHSVEQSEHYDVDLTVGTDGESASRELSFTVRAVTSDRRDTSLSMTGDPESSRRAAQDAEIDRMITEIELSDETDIFFPDHLEDGTRLTWKAADRQDRTALIFIPVMYAVLVVIVIRSALAEPAGAQAAVRREIMRGLPRFCNQLLLMMNAGMILSDAFDEICSCYSEYGEENMSWFEKSLTELCRSNSDHRTSTASLISGFAAEHNVKEMIRIATILTENEKRGSDVIESLTRESRYLWDDRKIVAREGGKMIDTRMSWPLAMLLMLLIIITMAPAMLSM